MLSYLEKDDELEGLPEFLVTVLLLLDPSIMSHIPLNLVSLLPSL